MAAPVIAGVEPYPASLDHLLAELKRLDLLLRVQVWRERQRTAAIAADEPEALLDRVPGAPPWMDVPLPPEVLAGAQTRLDELAEVIAERASASLAAGVPLRLVALALLFDLTAFDVDVVLACLAPELDRRYGRLYAHLHDDLAADQPTAELVLDLFCPDLATKVEARRRFGSAAPLRAHRLVTGEETLRLDPRVTRFLLADDELDDRLRPATRLVEPSAGLDALVLPDALTEQLARIVAHARTGGEDLLLHLQGPSGVGRRSAAAACCHALGYRLLVVDGRRLAGLAVEEFAERVALIDREARLQGALLCWEEVDALLADDRRDHLAALLQVLQTSPGPAFLTGETVWEPAGALHEVAFLRLTFPLPGTVERLRLWRAALDAGPGHVDLAAVAAVFRLSGAQIGDAAATARNLARARDPAAPQITQADLHAACRLQSNRKLAELAQQITPHYSWDDIVLPADQLAQLREIADQVRHRTQVYDTWGFEQKLAMGKGVNVLLAGPPGTGKTMAADVLAGTLGLDLYKIDLSTMVSKYIGETEKNLARVFAEARTGNAILFFDEADALFGKRTQVRDAHDRYANVEISYLLQKMEEYDGVVLLATNLRQNLDDAFVRRLHFTLELPVPGPADRLRIWEGIWPPSTPRAPDLDLALLAERIEVAGGSIRNIALASAFYAAADGGVVTMHHLHRATRREYTKIGKVLTPSELSAT